MPLTIDDFKKPKPPTEPPPIGKVEAPAEDKKATKEKDLERRLKNVEKILDSTMKLVEDLAAKFDNQFTVASEPPSQPETVKTAAPVISSEVLDAVRTILGSGSKEKCAFEIKTEDGEQGVSFRLTFIPPPHLRESESDKRSRMIPFSQALPEAKKFATIVHDYCIAYATRNGLAYFAE